MKAVVGFLLVCVVAVGVIVQMLAQLLPIVLIVAAVLVLGAASFAGLAWRRRRGASS